MRAFFPFKKREISWEIIIIPAFVMFLIFYFISLQGFSSVYNLVLNNIILTLLSGVFMFGFPFAFMKSKNIPLSEIGFRMPEKEHAGLLITSTIIIAIVYVFVVNLSWMFPSQVYILTKNAIQLGFSLLLSGDPRFFIIFFTFVFAVPFIEEFYFRGILYKHLRKKRGILVSIAINAAFFALFHSFWNTYFLYILTILLSVVACLLMEKTKSLVGPLIVHSFLNGFAFFCRLYIPNSLYIHNSLQLMVSTGLMIALLLPIFFYITNKC